MIKFKKILFIFFIVFTGFIKAKAQQTHKQEDTLKSKTLDSVFVSIYFKNAAPKYIAEVVGMNIYSGKKPTRFISMLPG